MPLQQDLRHSIRLLAKEPRFFLVAILTLALAIGAATALFSVIDAALLRAVPYPHPEQLAIIWVNERPAGDPSFLGPALNEVRGWQTSAAAQIQQACVWRTWTPEVIDTGEFDRVLIRRWSEGCADLYGVKPVIGRGFTAADTRIGAAPVAMIGFRYWQQRYAGSPDVLGRTITLDDGQATIVGIVPPSQDRTTSVFVPLRSKTRDDEERRGRGTETIVRLRPGVTLQQAEAAIDRALAGDASRGGGRARATAVYEDVTRGFRGTIRTLAYAVALILVLACVNVGGLLLARGAARQTEFAIRASLGASRARLIVQLLVESLVIAIAAGAIGVALAWGSLDTIVALVPLSLPADAPVTLNLAVLASATLAACVSALGFGLAPALRLSRRAAEQAMARTSRRGGAPLTRRLGQILIAVEVALAMVLMAGAGVMVRSLARLVSADLGFDASHVISMHVTLAEQKPEVLSTYFPQLWRSVRAVPGVNDAGATDFVPLIGGAAMGVVRVGSAFQMVESAQVLPGYFEAAGIRLVAGRLPVEADLHGPPAVVISEDAARKFFGTSDAVGRRIDIDGNAREVLAVVGTVQHWGPAWSLGRPKVYSLFGQDKHPRPLTIVLRLRPGVPLPADALRTAATSIGPRVFVEGFKHGSDWIGENTIRDRHRTLLFVLLGGSGLLLALAGVFSMTAYAVASRTREIGVRMALGARAGQVVGRLLRDAAWPVALGTAAGTIGAVAATRVIAAFLFNTTPTDSATFAVVALALCLAGCAAAWLPARHAARVDPVVALRSE